MGVRSEPCFAATCGGPWSRDRRLLPETGRLCGNGARQATRIEPTEVRLGYGLVGQAPKKVPETHDFLRTVGAFFWFAAETVTAPVQTKLEPGKETLVKWKPIFRVLALTPNLILGVQAKSAEPSSTAVMPYLLPSKILFAPSLATFHLPYPCQVKQPEQSG
jgi:hypothetical protein